MLASCDVFLPSTFPLGWALHSCARSSDRGTWVAVQYKLGGPGASFNSQPRSPLFPGHSQYLSLLGNSLSSRFSRSKLSAIAPASLPRVGASSFSLSKNIFRKRQNSIVSALGQMAGSAVENGDMNTRQEEMGVVIVDHGSRRKESNELLSSFLEVYIAETGRGIVELAHMELAEPTIAQAFDKCVARGARVVVISPYFLSPGRHWNQDIPALAAEAARKHPGVKYLVTAPIGVHRLVAQVVEERIQHCLSRAAGEVEECDVCAGTGRCQMQAVEAASAPS
eukprot:jgi/Mesen1/5052/ME000252S04162